MSADQATRAQGYYEYDIARVRRRASGASMQWRSRIIRFMAWSCSGVVLSLLVTFMIYSGVFDSGNESLEVEQAKPAESVNVGDLRFTGFDKKNQAYAITADSAEQDENRPNIIYLAQVKAEMKLRGSGDVVFVTAQRGIYDTEADSIRLENDITLKSTSGYTASLRSADVLLKAGRVHSEEPVVVTMASGMIWSNAVDMWDRGKRILFKNRIRVLFEVKDRGANDG